MSRPSLFAGGHKAAGTCQVENDRAARTLVEIISRIPELEAEARGKPLPARAAILQRA